jgi:hypothetical protein
MHNVSDIGSSRRTPLGRVISGSSHSLEKRSELSPHCSAPPELTPLDRIEVRPGSHRLEAIVLNPPRTMSELGQLRRTQYEHMFSALPSNSDVARRSRHVSNVPISEVPDATLWRRQKQRNYSRRQTRNGRMDASAMGCEAKALQRSLPDEALSIVSPGLRP